MGLIAKSPVGSKYKSKMKIQEITLTETNKLKDLQPEGWPDIVSKFEFYIRSDFCFPIKVTIENKIVGIGATIIHGDSAWLADIIVNTENRNKGIGKILTQNLIDQAKQKKCKTILLIATELGSYVYEKLGFHTETEYVFHKVSKNKSKYIPSKYVIPFEKSLMIKVLDFDKNISGENRSENIIEHLEKSMIYIKEGEIQGYFMPTLGEGHILASNETVGIELLRLRLNTHENIIIPVNNISAKKFTSDNKYDVFYKAKRMCIGEKINTNLSNIYARIGGNMG